MINQEDLKEFRQEGSELLEAAEKALLSLEDNGEYKTQYNAIFRAFHNLKGAAGMMEMLDLQGHTHVLETQLVSLKELDNLTADQIDYFLKGIDSAKKMLMGDQADAHSMSATETDSPITQNAPDNEKQKLNIIEPTRYLLFSEGNELTELEQKLKDLGYEVHNHTDYIDGITKYDSLNPHVILVSPKFVQTSVEELASIVHKDSSQSLFVCFDYSAMPFALLMRFIRLHFENINLKNLAAEASHLLKYQYADLCDYLRSTGKQHLEKSLTEEMRDFLGFKSAIAHKFKTGS